MKCLVTGATGFVGSRLLTLLDSEGYEVTLLTRSKADGHKTIVCNLGKDKVPEHAFDDVDVVFHLAGFAHDTRNSSKTKKLYESINVDSTIQLAKMSVKSGVKSFVFVSSTKAGGRPSCGKCGKEYSQNNPEGIYGRSKRTAELGLLEIGKESEMHVSIVRPSLVYGPGVKGNLRLMLLGIQRGWFPPLPEINNRRSMVHVDDLSRAILLVSKDKRANGGVFIVTDGMSYSSRDIYNVMCGLANKPIPRWSVPKIIFDIAGLLSARIKYNCNKLLGDECYSSSKLKAIGFTPKKTLRDMNETDF